MARKPAPRRSTFLGHRVGYHLVNDVSHRQGSIGNQATLRLLRQQASKPAGSVAGQGHLVGSENMVAPAAPRGAARFFGKIPMFPPDRATMPPIIQPKLEIGAVDDPLEHEADRVADKVMRMPDPSLSVATAPVRLSRKCAACEEEDKVRMLNSHPVGVARTAAGAPPIVDEVLRSPGQPLDPASRGFFEPRFGHDFSQVRIHSDSRASESARAVMARAYTVGRHIVVAGDSYSPGSASGRRLLAHELTHVLQQGNAQRTDGNLDRADRSGAQVPISTMQPSGEGRVQRQELDPNQLLCMALCAICAGSLVVPEFIIPEVACAFCFKECPVGMAAAEPSAPGQGTPGPSAAA